MTIRNYRDLQVWQKSMQLVTDIYQISRQFPKDEIYGLTSQLRRAAVSVPSNIAEGHAKRTTRDYLRFLNIAYGSLAEVETQLSIGENLNYASSHVIGPLLAQASEIARMLNGLIAKLEDKLPESRILNPVP